MKNEILTACYQLVAATVNGTYQGILITILVAASLRMLRRSNAATRCAVWFGTLLLLALIIPAHCLRSRWDAGDGSSKSQAPNPKEDPSSKFQTASSPPAEEREEDRIAWVHGSNADSWNVGAFDEPSHEHAAPTELWEAAGDLGSYRHGVPTELFNADHGPNARSSNVEVHRSQNVTASEYVSEQQYGDSATGAGADSQSAEDRVRPFVLALLEAATPNPSDESATPESGFLLGIKQKLGWLGERALRPLPSWTVTTKTPLFVAALFPIVWLAIAGGKVSLLIWQLLGIHRLKLNSADPSPELNGLFRTLRENIGLRRNVTLKVSPEHRSAVVLGFFKPVILLPADAGLEAAEHILRHELAHVRRGDDWTNLGQHFIKALFFFHPAIWWVSKRISLEREIACDDQVLQSTRRPKAYALLLADLAGRMQPSVLAPGVSTNQSQLKQRIDMILNSDRNTSPRLAKARLGLLATAAVLLAMAAIYLAPRLAFAQTAAAPVPALDAPSATIASASPSAGVAVSEDAPTALLATPGVPASPKFKSSSEISVDVRPAIAPRPSIAILAAPSPALPPVASVTMAPPVPVAPTVASADIFPAGSQPGTPRPAHRPGRDSSLEDRLDRLEKMVESLVAQQRGKPGQFDFAPKTPAGEMKFNWKNSPDAANQWEHAQADFARKHAEFELRRADADKRLAELKAWKDQKGPEKVKELAEKQTKMAVDQAKVAEQAAREAQRAARDAQRGRNPHKMRDGSHQELEGLHKQREMLEKQMEKLDRQIEKLERDQEQFDEQQENDEQEENVQQNQNNSSSELQSELSNQEVPSNNLQRK